MEPETLLTEVGLAKLHEEMEHLVEVRRPAVIARIKEAREHGDLKENSEYHDARNEQAFIETKIRQIDRRIRTAKIIENVDTSTVGMGTRVSVTDVEDGEKIDYVIVGTAEADPVENRVSNESPIGSALMGKAVGDTVEVELPRGSMQLRIESISSAA